MLIRSQILLEQKSRNSLPMIRVVHLCLIQVKDLDCCVQRRVSLSPHSGMFQWLCTIPVLFRRCTLVWSIMWYQPVRYLGVWRTEMCGVSLLHPSWPSLSEDGGSRFFRIVFICQSTQFYLTEDHNLYIHHCGNFKYFNSFIVEFIASQSSTEWLVIFLRIVVGHSLCMLYKERQVYYITMLLLIVKLGVNVITLGVIQALKLLIPYCH